MTDRVTTALRTAVATAAALIALAASGGPALAADSNTAARLDFNAEPAAGSLTGTAGSYFVIAAEPGQQIRQAVTVSNQTSASITLALHAESATTAPLGGVSYSVQQRSPNAPSPKWLRLAKTRVTLAPKSSTIVPFSVTMPRSGTQGLHLAGISVERITKSAPNTTAQPGTGAGVIVHSRRIIGVQVTTPGAHIDNLRITTVTADPRPDAMYLLVHMRNDGTTLLKGSGDLRVDGDTDAELERSFKVDTFVPRTAIEYPIKWTKRPTDGEFQASVQIQTDAGTARWSGTVTVGQRQLREFDDRSGDATARPDSRRLLWLGLATAALTLALSMIFLRRRSISRIAAHDL